jgi:hypothetical protein
VPAGPLRTISAVCEQNGANEQNGAKTALDS